MQDICKIFLFFTPCRQFKEDLEIGNGNKTEELKVEKYFFFLSEEEENGKSNDCIEQMRGWIKEAGRKMKQQEVIAGAEIRDWK